MVVERNLARALDAEVDEEIRSKWTALPYRNSPSQILALR